MTNDDPMYVRHLEKALETAELEIKGLEEELHEKYRQLCEKNREKQVTTVSLEEARKNKLNLF